MSTAISKIQRQVRTRSRLHGTKERPRLSVNISNRQVAAQLINDDSGQTVAAVSSLGAKEAGSNMTAKATWVGQQIAAAAAKHKIKRVVFDRGARIYHGRLHALATAARDKGLEF